MKVSKVKIYIGEVPKEIPIHYKGGLGFFVQDLPEDFRELTGFPRNFQTEEELKERLGHDVVKYREIRTTKRIVIAFRVKSSPDLIMHRVGEGSYEGRKEGISTKVNGGNKGCSVEVIYGVYEETFDLKTRKYRLLDRLTLEPTNSYTQTLDMENTIIPYTEERLEFFLSMERALQEVLLKLSAFFFSGDEQTLLDKIDSTKRLL